MVDVAESVVIDPAANADATAQPVDNAGTAPAGGESVATPATPDEKSRVQARIDQLTRERYEAIARADRAERELQQRRTPEAPAKTEPVAPTKVPTLEDAGNDFDRHAQMVADYIKATTAMPSEDELFEKFTQRLEQRQQQTSQQSGWEKQLSELTKVRPDAVQKIYAQPNEGGPIITDSMREVLLRSDRGAEVAMHLADNREINEAIARMHPLDQARELGRIEAKLEAPKAAPVAKPPVSQAPPPAPTIAAASDAGEKDPLKMTDAQYAKWRRNQIAQRR